MAVLLAPLPHAFNKFFPAQILAPESFLCQGLFHHVLCGDTGMVRTGDPQHVLALLAVVAAQGIDKGQIESMSYMQRACDVRRRNDNAVWIAALCGIRGEGLVIAPAFAPFCFHIRGLVTLGKSVGHLAFSMKVGDSWPHEQHAAHCNVVG